ncbi:MAG TPA: trehalose-phosphatase [Burkholderiales bacterium]|nr:trehalose-phosphatase [Burkholderiales bacterium]
MQPRSQQTGGAGSAYGRTPAFSPDWAFFLDIDGTLLEHAERPDAVRADPALGRLLAGLQRACGGALALISGRPVAEMDALFAPLRLPAAGQHGVERRDARGTVHRHAIPAEPLRRAARRLGDFAARHAGMLLEDKGHSLALHFRLAPELSGAARAAVAEALAELGPQFEMQAGKLVFELKPGGRDKGTAIEEFMRETPFLGRTPVFIGDDLTDEYGFGIVNRLGGHAIKVGEGHSAAPWRLADAAAVRCWLAGFVERYAGGGNR